MARLDDLEHLRDLLRDSLNEAPAAQRAALAAQFRATLAEIAELSPEEKAGDPVDEVAARRAARGGATARSRRATSH